MSPPIRGRYAPSPTGNFHLGNARTALLAWLDVRSRGGAFVMRIEDVDRGRCRPQFERTQLEDLRWLGLDWDEGPDVGGEVGPYRQSQRGHLYEAALERLETYPCTCTRRELREAGPVYTGRCRDGVSHPDRRPGVRWSVAGAGSVAFDDELCGPQRQDIEAEVGDVVLRRGDGDWAYQLAVVVDDAAMGISRVVRGADLLDSTPRQIALQRALGLPTPAYVHAPLLRGDTDAKLSKRDGAPDLTTLRRRGESADRVVAYLARSCGLAGPGVQCLTARELVGDFDWQAVVDTGEPALDPARC